MSQFLAFDEGNVSRATLLKRGFVGLSLFSWRGKEEGEGEI